MNGSSNSRLPRIAFRPAHRPESIRAYTDFASVIEPDVPRIVQYTRLDLRRAENALMTTLAFAEND